MSKSPKASAIVRPSDQFANDVRGSIPEDSIQDVLEALGDADGRAILEATSDGPLTANEVSETCDLPLSTTYRKLDLLTGAGLLDERTRIRRSGKHASVYTRVVDDVVISLGLRGETEVRVSRRNRTGLTESAVSKLGD